MYHLLSYPIDHNVPAWPGSPQLNIIPKLQIVNGDAANTVYFSLYNHIGTHMDAPNHYLENGIQIAQLSLEHFIYEKPLLLQIPKRACEKVTTADLIPYTAALTDCDLLMIYSGFSAFRSTDTAVFEEKGPAIDSNCAAWLVEHCPSLKALAVDFVSLASFSDQQDGNKTHQILFQGKNGHFICGIEDVNMSPILGKTLKKVIALPLMIQGLDSAPVTIIAETE